MQQDGPPAHDRLCRLPAQPLRIRPRRGFWSTPLKPPYGDARLGRSRMTVSRQVLVPYDELEIRLIEAVAAVAAPVLASAQRQSDGVRRQQGATELSRLAGSLTQSLSARTVGERLVQAIIPLVHGVDAAFWDATGRLTIPGSGPLALLREPCDPRVERVVELVRS